MGNRAADIMERQAHNLWGCRRRLKLVFEAVDKEVPLAGEIVNLLNQVDIAMLDIHNIATALSAGAQEEREAGKRWWKQQESKIRHRPRVDGGQIPPKVEPWW